jgi:plasmid stability protein
MATATARKVDDDHYRTLAESAARNGRSISAELRDWIAECARKREAEKLMAEMRAIRSQTKDLLGPYPDSVALVRAVRDQG